MATSSQGGQAGIGGADWLEKARAQLRRADPELARVIAARPDFDPRRWMTELPPMDLFGSLLFQIAGQQLSVAATGGSSSALRHASVAVSRRPPTC